MGTFITTVLVSRHAKRQYQSEHSIQSGRITIKQWVEPHAYAEGMTPADYEAKKLANPSFHSRKILIIRVNC